MRKIYLLLALCYSSIYVSAQIEVPVGDTATIIESIDVFDIAYHFDISNTSNADSYEVRWRMSVDETTYPTEWLYYFCDDNACYLPWTKECPESSPNTLGPGETKEWILHTEPSGITGTHHVLIEFFDHLDTSIVFETLVVEVTATGSVSVTELNNVRDLNVYPNPVDGQTNISFELEERAEVNMQVIDLGGRTIANQYLGSLNGSVNVPFDASALSTGTYLLQIKAGNAISTRKIFVK